MTGRDLNSGGSRNRLYKYQPGKNDSLWPISISEELLKPVRSQRGIACPVLNIPMPKIRLDRTCIVTVIGELVAAGVAQHVGMRFDAKIGPMREKPAPTAGRYVPTRRQTGKPGFPAGGGGAHASHGR